MNRIADEKKPYLKPKQFRGKKGKVKQYGK